MLAGSGEMALHIRKVVQQAPWASTTDLRSLTSAYKEEGSGMLPALLLEGKGADEFWETVCQLAS